MNPSQHEETIFEAARILTSSVARKAFLDSACEGDDRLRERLESLLSVEGKAEEFFKAAAPSAGNVVRNLSDSEDAYEFNPPENRGEAAPFDDVLGTRIGPYKILQKIGEGGCGNVYLAEQESPLRRRVALKIIKLGMDTKNVIARFEAERQALAMMDHINIARVFDAGATETGRPFFVMELVRGTKITDFCSENNLDTRQRLTLFLKICQAIQHAHQKGVIHRDIKPSNILVTLHDGVPVPKVIDFGIAKAIEVRLTDKTLFTAYEQLVGTPAYMSPEQAELSGLDVDTRSDIYSLGVLLYELLTGKTPFDAKTLLKGGLDEMRRTLREREPQRPSTIVTTLQGIELQALTSQRRVELPKLISLLKGDLDWIVMKSLEKDRTRRYETANGLAMDIQRYLNNEPVAARPPSRVYRFQKLVRRNKGVFAAVGAVTLALVAGLGVSTVLFFRERAAKQRAVSAEQEQAALRLQADQMRANEARLRLESENREKVTMAIVRLRDGDFEAADALLGSVTMPQVSLEYAEALRSTGEWHALRGDWQAASGRFSELSKIGGISGWDLASLDLLRQGVSVAELKKHSEYDKFCETAISLFGSSTNPVAAERMVKICLLEPKDSKGLERLNPAFELAARTFLNVDTNADYEQAFHSAWGSVSLALMEYRRGNFSESLFWCRHSMSYPSGNLPRTATVHAIKSMVAQRLGNKQDAAGELALGREIIDANYDETLKPGTADRGFWFDWIFARLLLEEAASQINIPTQ
jgi:serine/threonine protein kinase